MPESEPPSFATPEEEARYYRVLSKDLQDELEDLKLALSEFQSSSKELEDEMEKELANTERREAELRHEAERLRSDVDSWKGRHQDTLKEHSKTMQHMQQELERLRSSEKALRDKLRDIELDNDDLEKSERAISSTLSDVESRYNKAIERTALLEQELVDKARLEEELQRTKDELRENIEELAVLNSARDEAVANAASTQARMSELESRLAQNLDIPAKKTSVQAAATPPRSSSFDNASSRIFTMPPPDIDSADIDSADIDSFDEGTPTGRGAHVATSGVTPSAYTASSLCVPQSTSKTPAPNQGMTRSDTFRDLASVNLRQSYSPATTREKKSEGIISDMRGLTLRMQTMSKSLNTRREIVMAGSAIPRPTPRKSAVVLSSLENEVPFIPRSISAYSMNGGKTPTTSASGTHESFKSPMVGRPASRLGSSSRMTPSLDKDRSSLKASRPSSRLSYGSSARPQTPGTSSRPSTPSHPDGSATAARAFRRISLGPNSVKRTSRLADDKSIPPVPVTPTNEHTASKRNSLANSIKRPITAANHPVWRS